CCRVDSGARGHLENPARRARLVRTERISRVRAQPGQTHPIALVNAWWTLFCWALLALSVLRCCAPQEQDVSMFLRGKRTGCRICVVANRFESWKAMSVTFPKSCFPPALIS